MGTWTQAVNTLKVLVGGGRTVSAEPLPGVGHALAMAADPLRLFCELAREHGGVAPIRFGPGVGHLVTEPSLVAEIFVKHQARYSRKTTVYEAMADFVGASILTTEGSDWKVHRRVVQPAFHKKKLAAFSEAITRITAQHLERWSGEIDVSDAMMRLTLQIVSETLLGTETAEHAEVIGRVVEAGQRHAERAMSRLFNLPEGVPTPQRRALARTRAAMDEVTYDLIERRHASGVEGYDAVSMLLAARYEDGTPLSRERIRNEVVTLLAAGHETTSNALTWTLMRLSSHPAVLRKLRAELDDVLGDRTPGFEDVSRLTYTRWVFDEAMRLHPPAWATGRIVLEGHRLGELEVSEGDLILLSPYVTQRRPDLWTNPEGFDPDRWEALSVRGALPPFTFYPFGGGTRKCVGEAFAYLEAVLILAMIVQRLDLHLTGRPIVPLPQITLGVAHGMWMDATPRPAG